MERIPGSERTREKLRALMEDRSELVVDALSSSYRNGRNADLMEAGVKRSAASTVSTERA